MIVYRHKQQNKKINKIKELLKMNLIKINKDSYVKYTILNGKLIVNKIKCKAKDLQEIMDTLELIEATI